MAVEIGGWPREPFAAIVDALTPETVRTGGSFTAAPSRYPHVSVAYASDGAEDVEAVALRLSFYGRRRTAPPAGMSVPRVEEDSAQRGDAVEADLTPLALREPVRPRSSVPPSFVYRITTYPPADRDEHGHYTGVEDTVSDHGPVEAAYLAAIAAFAEASDIDRLEIREPAVTGFVHFGVEPPVEGHGLGGLFPPDLTGYHDGAEVLTDARAACVLPLSLDERHPLLCAVLPDGDGVLRARW